MPSNDELVSRLLMDLFWHCFGDWTQVRFPVAGAAILEQNWTPALVDSGVAPSPVAISVRGALPARRPINLMVTHPAAASSAAGYARRRGGWTAAPAGQQLFRSLSRSTCWSGSGRLRSGRPAC